MTAAAWSATAKTCMFFVLGVLPALACRAAGEADKGTAQAAWPQRWLPVDERGWSVLRPSGDSRLIYVSNEGDDATANPYGPCAEEVGKDPLKPAPAVKPYKTLAAAVRQMRAGHPDWLLLRRGDAWEEPVGRLPSGRGRGEPAVLCGYGDKPQRPVIKLQQRDGFGFDMKRGFHDVAVVSVGVYAHTRDPQHPDFGKAPNKSGAGSAFFFFLGESSAFGERLLIEDCCFRYCGCYFTSRGTVRDIVFRRNLVLGNYSENSHAQGCWGSRMSMLMEENIFDHNGWLKQGRGNTQEGGTATMFNHNTYFCDCHEVVFRGNMFLRASSIGNKWTANSGPASARNLVMDNNLYVEGEIGFSIGGNETGLLRFKNVRVTNNVLLDVGRGRPTLRNLGWYLEILDWDGGLVANNLFLHQASPEITNVYAIHVASASAKGKYQGEGVHCRDVTIRDNVIHGLISNAAAILVSQGQLMQNVRILENAVQFPGLKTRMVRINGQQGGVSFAGNSYDTDVAPGEWFEIDRQSLDFDAWIKQTGEKAAKREKRKFPDSDRNIETYMTHLHKKPTFNAFIDEVRQQSKTNWREEFTAAAVNAWIREGFGVSPWKDDNRP